MAGELPKGWDAGIPSFPADPKGMATRVASGKVLNEIDKKLPSLIGGSADLDPSTHTALRAMGDFENPRDEAGHHSARRSADVGLRRPARHAVAGALDPLFAKAVVIHAGDDKLAIVGLDMGRGPTAADDGKNPPERLLRRRRSSMS